MTADASAQSHSTQDGGGSPHERARRSANVDNGWLTAKPRPAALWRRDANAAMHKKRRQIRRFSVYPSKRMSARSDTTYLAGAVAVTQLLCRATKP